MTAVGGGRRVDRDRVYGCLAGQAVGDALGAPTEGMTRARIRERYGRVEDFVADDPAGTDDTEYAVLTAQLILEVGHALSLDDVSRVWRERLAGQEGGFFRGGFSEIEGVANLRRGLSAPASGQDNHESFSDGAAMRSAPIGVYCAGDPAEAARLAGIEARVSHDRDGVWCAQAIAASVAVAMVSDSWEDVVGAGLAAVPEDSWSHRCIRRAVDIAGTTDGEVDGGVEGIERALDDLEEALPIRYYPWADVGPEATALAYGVFAAARGEYVASVLGGVNIGRDADTIAAMAGAMAGALRGAGAIPARWREQIDGIRGSCIHSTAGVRLSELADRFVGAASAASAASS